MTVGLITGASGMIAQALLPRLAGPDVSIFRAVRHSQNLTADELFWDPNRGLDISRKLTKLDWVIHLAGANVAGRRWNEAYKREIRESRVHGTRSIIDSLGKANLRPSVFLSASAVGFYGDRGEEELTEQSKIGEGYLSEVCNEWETETRRAEGLGARVINARFGVVLDPRGGALAKMLPPFRMGLGGRVGTGKQFMSWITLHDAIRALEFLLNQPDASGPVNLVAPQPSRNLIFTRALAKALHRPAIFAIPEFAISLLFGEMGRTLLLSSTKVLPNRLTEMGFEFNHPEIFAALDQTLTKN